MDNNLRELLEIHLKKEVGNIAKVYNINLKTMRVVYQGDDITIDHIVLAYDEKE